MKLRKLSTVFQKDDCGCWLAVAAMLTGKGYDLLRDNHKFRGNEVTGRSAKPLIELLAQHGVAVDAKCTRLSEKDPLPTLTHDALVYGKVHFRDGKGNRFKLDRKPPGHWLVWDTTEKVLRDPARLDGEMIVELRNFRRVLNRP